jgi:hypothetical protein
VRSAIEIRQRLLDQLPAMMARPGMWATDGTEMQAVAGMRLGDLCFIDGRDDEYRDTEKGLHRFGKVGVHGPFLALFGEELRCQAEVASVYAEQFHRLGYLAVDRLLDDAEWRVATGELRERFEDRDMRRSEIEAELGPPSLAVDRRVLCYAPSASTGWMFVDCWARWTTRYVPGEGHMETTWDPDPLVRDIRVPAESFEAGLILTLYGKLLRWGPGWWIDHPSTAASAESRAIAAQLKQIEADDPSQALRR